MILAIAVRTQAPLAEEIDALADSSRGSFRRRLRKLATRLRNGDALSDALENITGLAPPETVTAIRVGEELGNAVSVIQQEAVRLRRREESRLQGRISATGIIFYLCCVLWVMQGIVVFLMYWIVPKFKKIFQDFGVELPTATKALIRVTDYLADHAWAVGLWTFILFVMSAVWLIRRGGLAGLDWGFLSAVYPRMETPAVLRNLAQAVAVQRPLEAALAGLELHHRSRFIRSRIRRVRDEADRGGDCYSLLARSGLLSAGEAAALAAAQRAGNLGWALDGVADNIERRQRALGQLVVEVLQPAIVVALGVIVFFVSTAFFFPLLKLFTSTKLWA